MSTTLSKEPRKRISLTLPNSAHEAGVRLAQQGKRDFSHFIEVLIENEEQRRLAESLPAATPATPTEGGR